MQVESPLLAELHEVRRYKIGSTMHFFFTGQGGSLQIEKTLLGDTEAKALWEGKYAQLINLYQDYPAPYGGGVTQKVSCPKSYRPQPLDKVQNQLFWKNGVSLYSNDRKSLGVCDHLNFKYKVIYVGIYCKKTNIFFNLKLFLNLSLKNEDVIKAYDAIICKNEIE